MKPPDTCTNCGTAVPASFAQHRRVCPACLVLVSGGWPCSGRTSEPDAPATRWEDAFPQFEMEQPLADHADQLTWLARDLGHERRPVVLQLVSGTALERAGGPVALMARANRLRDFTHPGVARVQDAGDLDDAFYLVTERGDLWEPLTGADHSTAAIESLIAPVSECLATAREAGCPLRCDLRTTFRDHTSGRIILTPSLLSPEPDKTALARAAGGSFPPAPLEAGTLLGHCRLEEKIGEGGFGEVWRARQEHPAKRTVAIKILKQEAATPRLMARFDLERQALARLDHPHIARYFDGGTTPDGRPYFTMEWIEGGSITEYCQRQAHPLAARLRLFRDVCDAVHYAHQKGILHRDLKASNVMVAGQGNVKVIDFGIARALEDPLTDAILDLTRAEEFVGTPVTMSPEQAAGAGGHALDVRTDVYGLGMLLYELLTEQLPFDDSRTRDELRRRIRDDDPPKPSTRSKDPTMARHVRGDLDWIVFRCLEKDPDRRYDSVSALAADLDRHGQHQPVAAGPPDIAYRVRKYIRRHRVGLAAAAVVSAALMAGGVMAVHGWLVARKERTKALAALDTARTEAQVSDAVNRFLTDELLAIEESGGLSVANPRHQNIRLQTVLERAAGRIEGRFDGQPATEGALRQALASSFLATGDLARAGEQAETAAARLETARGAAAPRTLEALRLLASVRAAQGRYQDAEKILSRITSLAGGIRGQLPRAPRLAAETEIIQGDILLEQGKSHIAAGAYFQAADSPETTPVLKARALSGIAQSLEEVDPRSVSLARHEQAVTFAEEQLGKENPVTLEITRCYARFLGDLDQAKTEEVVRFAELMQTTRRRQQETLGADHPATLRTRFEYALANGIVEPLAAGALRELETIAAAAESRYPADHPGLLRFRLGVAIQQSRISNHQAAIDRLQSIITSGRRSAGEDHPVVVDATRQLAKACLALGRSSEALTHGRAAVDRARRGLSPFCRSRQQAVLALGQHLQATGEGVPDAIDLFHGEYRACAAALGTDNRIAAHYLDYVLSNLTHDRTGAAAWAAAQRALTSGGTPQATILSLLQLSVASQMSMRPSVFGRSPIPLPQAWFKLLEVNAVADTQLPKTPVPPALVETAAIWQFLALEEGALPPPFWETSEFDHSDWRTGPSPLGFGESDLATDVRVGRPDHSPIASVCFRHRFRVAAEPTAQPMLVRLRCDDGAIVFLNGAEILRVHLPDGPTGAETRADRSVGGREERQPLDFLVAGGRLKRGENVLAVRVFQRDVTSSDLAFSLALHAGVPTPLESLDRFDPAPAVARLDHWLPGLIPPLDDNWRSQVECVQFALFGQWDDAFAHSQAKSQASPEAATRLRWFQRTALERLGRPEQARSLFIQSLPERNRSAPDTLIDLTSHYNALITEPWHVTAAGQVHEAFLKDFPAGLNQHDGIAFDARGVMQLGSGVLSDQNTIRSFPTAVAGIAIGRPIARLHLLNGSLLTEEEDARIATVRIHYADGRDDQFPIRYQKETLSYMVGSDPPPDSVRTGWRGPDPYRPGNDKAVFIASWENPRPEIAVTTLDLVSEPADAALFLLGISVEPAAGKEPRSQDE